MKLKNVVFGVVATVIALESNRERLTLDILSLAYEPA